MVMFTGLIEATGKIAKVEPIREGLRFAVETELAPALSLGESIAVNGVCLTVNNTDELGFCAQISPETMRVTTLSELHAGQTANLERALPVDGRLGGHFVLGHVDGVGTISGINAQADFSLVSVTCPESLGQYIASKGAIAIDGISLTVTDLKEGIVRVQIVPYTWLHTNLKSACVGDAVNLECDIIGKYVVQTVNEMA